MVVFLVLSSLLLGFYLFIVLLATYGWFLRAPNHSLLLNEVVDFGGLSVIIPFRNEAHNLPKILSRLTEIHSPLTSVEFIFIDDHSTDRWLDIVDVNSLPSNVRFVNSVKVGKKQAIFKGVEVAQYNTILTTDADCMPNQGWVQTMCDTYMKDKCQLLFGPVTLEGNTSFLSYFQSIDYAAMAAVGGGSALAGKPFICSGANLMFSKSCYLSVFDDIKLEFASGDDVFLLHAFKQKGYRISFCKSSEALVRTSVEPTFSDLVKQRVRWGAKAKGYTDWFSIFVSLVVFLLCVAMIGSLALLSTHYYVPILLFLIKMVADGLFLSGILPLFQIRFRWFLVVIIQLFYPFWIVFIAAQGFWGTTRWKGRR
jgi:biofilm PGA synthesis N-glycosyltransferase PgaC